ANKVLPHDRMTMTFDTEMGEIVMEAGSNDDIALGERIRLRDHVNHGRDRQDAVLIIHDLRSEPLPIVEPADLHDRIVAAGYRSFLAVNTAARDQDLGIEFWSKHTNAFGVMDVPIARRIADHVALAVSHEQLAAAARQVAETRARADR